MGIKKLFKKFIPMPAESVYREFVKIQSILDTLNSKVLSLEEEMQKNFKAADELKREIMKNQGFTLKNRDLIFESRKTAEKVAAEIKKEVQEESRKAVGEVKGEVQSAKRDFQKTAATQEGIAREAQRQSMRAANSLKFNSTIVNSKWLKQQNFTAGGWSMDNAGLFTIFRILNDMKPKNILEFGLGQSSKLIHQYADYNKNTVKALTIEHDQQWIDFFINETDGYTLSIERHDIKKIDIDDTQTLSYSRLKELIKQKFDFIIVDGPHGSKRLSRSQILEFVKAGMPDRFCIIIDDTEREGEQETIKQLTEILTKDDRKFLVKEYAGEKNKHSLICSPDLIFLTSL
jgi:hypothetical protein